MCGVSGKKRKRKEREEERGLHTYGYRRESSEREASHAGSSVVGVSSLVASCMCVTTRTGRCM